MSWLPWVRTPYCGIDVCCPLSSCVVGSKIDKQRRRKIKNALKRVLDPERTGRVKSKELNEEQFLAFMKIMKEDNDEYHRKREQAGSPCHGSCARLP